MDTVATQAEREKAQPTNQAHHLMRQISVEQLSRDASALLDMAQRERVVIVRNGKALALLVGVENKDEEDYAWERDQAFWELIRARRKDKTISLEEIKKRYSIAGAKRATKKK